MNYWLCRNHSAPSEGPYLRSQIEAMFDRAELTTRSIVCPEGSKEWRPVLVMLGHVTEEEFLREQAIKKKALKKKRREKWVLRGSIFFMLMVGVFVALMVMRAEYLAPEAVAARQAEEQIRARDAQARRQSDRELQRDVVRPSPWDGSVDQVEKILKAYVRDPSSLKFNHWHNETYTNMLQTTVDFTTANGFGGPVRQRWTFNFNRSTGEIQKIFDADTGEDMLKK